jgi:hypothetical protein
LRASLFFLLWGFSKETGEQASAESGRAERAITPTKRPKRSPTVRCPLVILSEYIPAKKIKLMEVAS